MINLFNTKPKKFTGVELISNNKKIYLAVFDASLENKELADAFTHMTANATTVISNLLSEESAKTVTRIIRQTFGHDMYLTFTANIYRDSKKMAVVKFHSCKFADYVLALAVLFLAIVANFDNDIKIVKLTDVYNLVSYEYLYKPELIEPKNLEQLVKTSMDSYKVVIDDVALLPQKHVFSPTNTFLILSMNKKTFKSFAINPWSGVFLSGYPIVIEYKGHYSIAICNDKNQIHLAEEIEPKPRTIKLLNYKDLIEMSMKEAIPWHSIDL